MKRKCRLSSKGFQLHLGCAQYVSLTAGNAVPSSEHIDNSWSTNSLKPSGCVTAVKDPAPLSRRWNDQWGRCKGALWERKNKGAREERNSSLILF